MFKAPVQPYDMTLERSCALPPCLLHIVAVHVYNGILLSRGVFKIFGLILTAVNGKFGRIRRSPLLVSGCPETSHWVTPLFALLFCL